MRSIANWKDTSEYPKCETTSLARLAWEFLRRNPGYQNDWAEYLQLCRKIIPEYDPDDWRQHRFTLLDHPDYVRYDPPRLNGESEGEWTRRTGGLGRYNLYRWYAHEWGLKGDHYLPNPFCAYVGGSHESMFIKSNRVEIVTKHWRYFDRELYPPRDQLEAWVFPSSDQREALGFDYSIPIEPQLIAVREYLLSQQKLLIARKALEVFPNKIPRKELVVYLRMLDAEADGIDAAGIAKEIYPKEDNSAPDYRVTHKVNAALKIARKWRDDWYKLLPSMKK
jgi:hypothetical protein